MPIVADEFNLLTMTPEEQQKAHEDYRKKYRYLKRAPRLLVYYYLIGEKFRNTMAEIGRRKG
ncbi:hypothetical protein J6TS7_29750 [Paenibacillus dendritiformis]|nr:hypothetical protein J6TS7_29750 [Paenibacillus dendritiformis]